MTFVQFVISAIIVAIVIFLEVAWVLYDASENYGHKCLYILISSLIFNAVLIEFLKYVF